MMMGGHMRSCPCVCKPIGIKRSARGGCRESTCIASKLGDLGYRCGVRRGRVVGVVGVVVGLVLASGVLILQELVLSTSILPASIL